MSQSREVYPKCIVMRIPDGMLESGYEHFRALLVNENTAVTVKNGELEVNRVQRAMGIDLYDHLFSNYPAIYVGQDEAFAFHDLLHMNVSEFFGKYPCYGEFVKAAESYT